MEITDVIFRQFFDNGTLRAVVSITLDDQFAVHDIKVIQSKDKIFVAMPSRCKSAPGQPSKMIYRDIAHPMTAESRKNLEDKILEAYYRQIPKSDLDQEDRDFCRRQNGMSRE